MTINLQGFELETAARSAGTRAHAEGYNTQATGNESHAEGTMTAATGMQSHAEGSYTQAVGIQSHAEGYNTRATGNYSHAGGGSKATADAVNSWALGSNAPAFYTNFSRSQVAIYPVAAQTGGTTQATLTFDGRVVDSTPGGGYVNVLIVPVSSTYLYRLDLVCRRFGIGFGSQAWSYSGMIVRDAASARLAGSITQHGTWQDTTVGTVGFNTINNFLQITVYGSNANYTHYWAGSLTVVELTTAG